MTEPNILYECRSCKNDYTAEEIGAHENIVGTCPNCGGHRFRGHAA